MQESPPALPSAEVPAAEVPAAAPPGAEPPSEVESPPEPQVEGCGTCAEGETCEGDGASAACLPVEPTGFTPRWAAQERREGTGWACGVTVDAAGLTWAVTVQEDSRPALLKLGREGELIGSWPLLASDIGTTYSCVLAPTQAGGVYVNVSGTLSRMSAAGAVEWQVFTGEVTDLAVDDEDAVVIASGPVHICYYERCPTGRLLKFAADGTLRWQKDASVEPDGSVFHGLAIDARGQIHTVNNEGLLTLSPDGWVLARRPDLTLARRLAATPQGGLVLTGFFYERATFGTVVLDAAGPHRYTPFVLALDAAGEVRWGKVLSHAAAEVAVADSGRIGVLSPVEQDGCEMQLLEELSAAGRVLRSRLLPTLACHSSPGTVPSALAPAGADWVVASGFDGSLDLGSGTWVSEGWDAWVARFGP